MGVRPPALITEHLDDQCAAWLAERCEVIRCAPGDAAFAHHLARAEALVVRTYTRVDDALLRAAPALRVVGRAGVGLDNIDLAACAARAVRVVHTPDANTQAVAEYVIAIILDALRPRPTVGRDIGVEAWKSLRTGSIAPRQFGDLTLGILGLGRVGKRVARCASGFGAAVIYHDLVDIHTTMRNGAEPVSFDELIHRSDILTIHVDERPSNRGLINSKILASCASELLLINTSRGFVIDPAALARFLRANPAARAALDVHEPEPPSADHPLMGLANCRLLPHLGAATAPAHRSMSWVVRDVWRVLSGEPPDHEATPAGPRSNQ